MARTTILKSLVPVPSLPHDSNITGTYSGGRDFVMPYTRICERCGKEFICVHRNQRYCSRACFNVPKFYVCQVCGKEFRAPPSQKRKYCSRECFINRLEGHKRAEYVTTPCLVCEKKVTILKSKFDKGLGRFCSNSCRSSYYPQYRHPKGTKLVTRTTIKCKSCGKEFEVTPGQLRKGRQFCSRACINKGRPSPKRKPKVKRTCQHCGKEFEVYPSWTKKDESKFCSKECAYKGREQPQRTEHTIKKCRHCGKVIDLTPCQIQQRFCSPNCAYKYRGPTNIEEKLIDELDSREIAYKYQYQIRQYHIDFAFPQSGLAVEADGIYWHSQPDCQERDARKDADLQSQGWTVLRFTGDEIRESPQRCVDEIVKLLK